MTDSEKLQVLWERAQIIDLMHRYATAVDSKDWVTPFARCSPTRSAPR